MLVLVAALLPPATSHAQPEEIVCGTDEDAVVTIASGTDIERQIDRVLADRFMKACPNITIKILDDPELDDDRLGFYLEFFNERSSDLDVLQIDVVWPAALAEHLIDLSPYLAEADIEAHFSNLIEANTVDERLVAIPWYMEAGLLYYRQDLLDKYGLELPETWDELEETARIIQDGERAEGNGEFCKAQLRPCPIMAINRDPIYEQEMGELWDMVLHVMELDQASGNNFYTTLVGYLEDIPNRRMAGESTEEILEDLNDDYQEYIDDIWSNL